LRRRRRNRQRGADFMRDASRHNAHRRQFLRLTDSLLKFALFGQIASNGNEAHHLAIPVS